MSNEKPNKDRTVPLLLLNVLLTGLVIPLVGWVGVRLWDNSDNLQRETMALKVQVSVLQEKQTTMGLQLSDIQRKLENHMERTQGVRNP